MSDLGSLDLEAIGEHARDVLETALDDWHDDSPDCMPMSTSERDAAGAQLEVWLSGVDNRELGRRLVDQLDRGGFSVGATHGS